MNVPGRVEAVAEEVADHPPLEVVLIGNKAPLDERDECVYESGGEQHL